MSMMSKRLLVQTQLSNYDTNGKFILECDSGWQMVMGRVREMLRQNSKLSIDVMVPVRKQLLTQPEVVNPDLWKKYGLEGERRLNFIEHFIIPNAIVTRYDFDWTNVSKSLGLAAHRLESSQRYDAVYINDPMHLRNFKSMFHIAGGYQPRFYVHSHFVDVPSCPKFPLETSLWHGQCEAAIKADWNFWQCSSALSEFERESRLLFKDSVVDEIMSKSTPWDDGYSQEEILTPPDTSNVRFDPAQLRRWRAEGNVIIFVPNRIGGMGRSSDYTNCGKFMFEMLPKLRQTGKPYVVLAGNPSQKFSNGELEKMCGENGYVSLVPDSFTRDEFKVIARNSDIAVGLYDQDTYGGTVARECVELGCLPLWIDCNEYSSITHEVGNWPFLARSDFSDLVDVTSKLIDFVISDPPSHASWAARFRFAVRTRCSYESTTVNAMKKMGLMP